MMIRTKEIYEELEHCTDNDRRLSLLFELTTSFLNFDEKRSLEVAEEISLLAEQLDNNKGRSYYHSAKARVFFKKSRFADAAREFQRASEKAMLTDDLILQAICLDSLGVIYCQQNKCEEALEASHKALAILKKMGIEATLGYQITAYNNIGNVYKRINDLEKAEQTYLQGLKLLENDDDERIKFNILNNLCAINLMAGKHKEALKYAQPALEGFKRLNHKNGEVHATVFVGHCLLGLDEYAKALEYYLAGIKLLKQVDHKPIEVQAYRGMGDVYMKMEAYPEALKNYKKALDVCMLIDDAQETCELYQALTKSYFALGNKAEALEMLELGMAVAKANHIDAELTKMQHLKKELRAG